MLGHGGSSASPTLLPHPLAQYCHYPVSKCRSAWIAVTGTVRVNLKCSISMALKICIMARYNYLNKNFYRTFTSYDKSYTQYNILDYSFILFIYLFIFKGTVRKSSWQIYCSTQVYTSADIQVNCTRFTYEVNTYRSTTQDSIQAGWYTQLNINSVHTKYRCLYLSTIFNMWYQVIYLDTYICPCSHREYIFLLIFK